MDGALFGTETEYACAGSLSPTEAATRVKDGVFASRKFGLISPASVRPRAAPPRAGGPSALLALPDSRPRASAPTPSVPFQISQRAQHVSVDVSHRVRFGG